MDILLRLEATEAASDLLRRFGEEHPDWQGDATPLERIITWLGCEIETFHPDDYPDGTYGFVEPGEQLIWLRRDLSPTLRRFTLAHELGHVLLHAHEDISPTTLSAQEDELQTISDTHCQGQDVSEDLTGLFAQEHAEELLGPGFVYDPRSRRELAANLFAAELLMPLERVEDLYITQRLSPDVLATRFNVSQAALLNRLAGLLGSQPTSTLTPESAQEMSDALLQTAPAKSYDEFQQSAIETPTPALIVAGPGSGKTSTLIGRVQYLLQREEIRPEQILALTFSRKAAQEMQERLQAILPAHLPAPTISTFHAFCAELLRMHGARVGLRQDFELVDDAEGYFLLQNLAENLPLRHYQNLHNPAEPFQHFLKAISRAKDELVSPARYRELAEQMHLHAESEETTQAAERALEVAAVYELYQRALERRGDSDFGGLLMLTVQLLEQHAEMRAEMEQRYQHILVDEFQDINRASGVLLRLLAGEQQRVWVVGDLNQAIYGFRGASPANITHFHQDYPDARVLPLSRNYRSRPDIVSLADTFKGALLEQDQRVGAVQTVRATHSDPYITLAIAPNEAHELRGLVYDIQQKLAEGYTCRDIVVLCRTRDRARRITRALARAGLPVYERASIFEQEHIRDLLSLLLLFADNSGMGLLRAAHLPAHPFGQADVEELLLEARALKTAPLNLVLRGEMPLMMSQEGQRALERLATILKNLHHCNSIWTLLARYMLLETSLARELLEAAETSHQARLVAEDYARLLQYAHTYDQRRQARQQELAERAREREEEPPAEPGIEEQARDFLAYLQVLAHLRQEGEGKHEEGGAEDEGMPAILRVMTVHASKGLEFPVVYLPGLARGRFPLRRQHNPVPPPYGMLPPASEDEQAHESGEACLFYVGTTRARDQLILSHSERYGKQSAKRSSYIDALLVGLPDERVRRVLWHDEEPGAPAEMGQPQAAAPIVSSQPSQVFIGAMQPDKLRSRDIEEYQTCPRRYAYSSIYGFQSSDGSYLPFWQATSETLKALIERMAAGEQPTSLEEVAELFQHAWHAQGGEARPFAHVYERHGEEIAAQVWQQLQDQQADRWQMRQSLTVHLAGQTIEVPIDRVESSTQGAQSTTFVRARMGKSKSKPEAGTRELLYLHARRQHHAGREVRLETHNLSTGERHEITVSARKEQSLLSELEQAVQGIERHDYTPRPDARTCSMCPFALICPA